MGIYSYMCLKRAKCTYKHLKIHNLPMVDTHVPFILSANVYLPDVHFLTMKTKEVKNSSLEFTIFKQTPNGIFRNLVQEFFNFMLKVKFCMLSINT